MRRILLSSNMGPVRGLLGDLGTAAAVGSMPMVGDRCDGMKTGNLRGRSPSPRSKVGPHWSPSSHVVARRTRGRESRAVSGRFPLARSLRSRAMKGRHLNGGNGTVCRSRSFTYFGIGAHLLGGGRLAWHSIDRISSLRCRRAPKLAIDPRTFTLL